MSSRTGIILRVHGRTVRCASSSRFAVAFPYNDRLKVSKRSDQVQVVAAHLRKIRRDFPKLSAYVFDLTTGSLLYTHTPGAIVPDESTLASFMRAPQKGRS